MFKNEHIKSRFEEMLEVFDKKYIEDLFEEGIKIGAVPTDKPVQGIRYSYNGYIYRFERQRVY